MDHNTTVVLVSVLVTIVMITGTFTVTIGMLWMTLKQWMLRRNVTRASIMQEEEGYEVIAFNGHRFLLKKREGSEIVHLGFFETKPVKAKPKTAKARR